MAGSWRRAPWQAATAAYSCDQTMAAPHLRLGAGSGGVAVAASSWRWTLNFFIIFVFVFGLFHI
jgi:hypothetical protein